MDNRQDDLRVFQLVFHLHYRPHNRQNSPAVPPLGSQVRSPQDSLLHVRPGSLAESRLVFLLESPVVNPLNNHQHNRRAIRLPIPRLNHLANLPVCPLCYHPAIRRPNQVGSHLLSPLNNLLFSRRGNRLGDRVTSRQHNLQ